MKLFFHLLVLFRSLGSLAASHVDSSQWQTVPNRFEHNPAGAIQHLLKGGANVDEYSGPPQPMMVIGAGLPRTGTASFKTAMDMLGYKCHHMIELLETNGKEELWHQHLVQKSLSFDEIMNDMASHGFNATVDMPTAFKYKEQINRYPKAKVILTVRSEEGDKAGKQWAKSMVNTILQLPRLLSSIPLSWFPRASHTIEFLEGSYAGVDLPMYEHEKLPAFYDSWNEEVMKTVNRENLLVFRAKDGWKPLCDFLGPVSEIVQANCARFIASGQPYPRVNDTDTIKTAMSFFTAFSLFVKAFPGVVLTIAVVQVFLKGSLKSAASRNKKHA
ncbi:expressed unknown protein [Seminavis robusta]|uniref:Uncharacterized protein n=1 Tax=Seminavis robusta TaxID=568900 RepID=A0A9N8ECX5_9STRA|nr:expressed unknown protein [Seminavis robusta]|eukprot:Sro895_g217240.1 n/a (330) ;mRNA; f:35566-36555